MRRRLVSFLSGAWLSGEASEDWDSCMAKNHALGRRQPFCLEPAVSVRLVRHLVNCTSLWQADIFARLGNSPTILRAPLLRVLKLFTSTQCRMCGTSRDTTSMTRCHRTEQAKGIKHRDMDSAMRFRPEPIDALSRMHGGRLMLYRRLTLVAITNAQAPTTGAILFPLTDASNPHPSNPRTDAVCRHV